jgi:hypothetical protein
MHSEHVARHSLDEAVPPAAFYDDLAGEYQLIFEDWWESALEHGEIIDRLLLNLGPSRSPPPRLHVRDRDPGDPPGSSRIPGGGKRYQPGGRRTSEA